MSRMGLKKSCSSSKKLQNTSAKNKIHAHINGMIKCKRRKYGAFGKIESIFWTQFFSFHFVIKKMRKKCCSSLNSTQFNAMCSFSCERIRETE